MTLLHPVIVTDGAATTTHLRPTHALAAGLAVDIALQRLRPKSPSVEDHNLMAEELASILDAHGLITVPDFSVRLTAPVGVDELHPVGFSRAEALLQEFCEIMKNSGGCYTGTEDSPSGVPGVWEPSSDREWTDLGHLYATACRHLGVTPLLDGKDAAPEVWPFGTEKGEFSSIVVTDPRKGPVGVALFISRKEIDHKRAVNFCVTGRGMDILEYEPRDTIHLEVQGEVVDLDAWESKLVTE